MNNRERLFWIDRPTRGKEQEQMDGLGEMKGVWVGNTPYAHDDNASIINRGEPDERRMTTGGEIMLRGNIESGRFVLEDVLRIAFLGNVADGGDNSFGEVTVVGPLPETVTGVQPVIEQTEGGGLVTDLRFRVHYRQLTLDAVESGRYSENKESDTRIPPVVRMKGELSWEASEIGDDRVTLAISLQLVDDEETNDQFGLKNLARTMLLAQGAQTELYSVADAIPDDSQEWYDYGTPDHWRRICTRPEEPCDEGAVEMLIRRLNIRFVCLFNATDEEKAELPALCSTLVDGVCEVWRNQAILAAVVRHDGPVAIAAGLNANPIVEFPGQLLSTEEFFDDKANWTELINLPSADAYWTVDVFIARDVIRGGNSIPGVSYDLTVVSAGVVLALPALHDPDPAWKYLLAHELGHCLGLEHPGVVTLVNNDPLPQGSSGSVMEIVWGHASNKNSAANCAIFDEHYAGQLNPLAWVIVPLRKDCLRPLL